MGIMQTQMSGWHLGMTNVVEQDLDFEKGEPMNSALLIKNFDPNIILQSLVLRSGRVRYIHDCPSYLDNLVIYRSGLYNVSEFPIEHSIQYDGRDLGSDYILGIGMLETTRPTYFKSPIIFLKDKIDDKHYTNIVSGIIEYYYDNALFKWHDIWNIPKGTGNFSDKGIRVQGELEDWYAYANLVVLTTTKSKSEYEGSKVYPVYVYAYDDRGKYLKYNLMPWDVKSENQDATWKVRKPSQFLFESDQVRQLEMLNLSPIFTPIYIDTLVNKNYLDPHAQTFTGFGKKINNGYYETLAKTLFSNWKGDRIFPYNSWSIDPESKPNDSEVTSNLAKITNINKNYSALANSVDVIFWQTDRLPSYHQDVKEPYPTQFTAMQTGYNFLINKHDLPVGKDDFHLTVEQLNHTIEPYGRVNGHSWGYYENGSNLYMAGHNPTDVVELSNGFSYYQPLDKIKARIKYNNTEEIRSVNLYPSFMGDTNDRNLDTSRRSGYTDLQDMATGGLFSDRDNDTEAGFITFCLPKYVEKELPRHWLAQEDIPYVLTAMVGGIEIEVKRGTYTIPNSYEFPALPHGALYKHIEHHPIPSVDFKVSCPISANTLRTGNPYTVIHNQTTHMHFTSSDEWLTFPKGQDVKDTTQFPWNANLVKLTKTDGGFQDMTHNPYLMYSRNPFTMFTLRFNFETIDSMLDSIPSEITEFKLYISAADTTSGLVSRTIDGVVFSPADMGYSKPVVQDKNDNEYRLVKRFIIRGEEGIQNIDDKWTLYKRELQGSETYLGTNSWTQISNNNGSASIYNNIGGDQDSGIYAVPEGYNQTTTESNKLNLRNVYGSGIAWTPDFYLWDYGLSGDFLSQNLVATGEDQIWKGTGARLLTVTRGATVIAGCQNEFYEEEEGIIRVSLVQNGNISNDIFPEINKLYVGRAYFTAIANFREQIILFSKTAIYRVILNDLTDASSWEVFDAIDGQGTLSPKTVVVTPYGVCFANNSSIWFTDGMKVNNIGKPIELLYRQMIGKRTPHTITLMFNEIPYVKDLQLVYESRSNELHVVFNTDTLDKTIHLIYNFEFQNWRMNEISTTFEDQGNVLTIKPSDISGKHKTLYDEPENGIIRVSLGLVGPYTSQYHILYWDMLSQTSIDDQIPKLSVSNLESIYKGQIDVPISGTIITHDIGNGIDDYLLEDCILEAYPTHISNPAAVTANYDRYNVNDPDPQLIIAPRHLSNANISAYPNSNRSRDIIKLNMKDQWFKWLHRTSPTNKAPSTNGYTSTRESFIYKSPFGISFRKSVFIFKTKSMSMVRSIHIKIRSMQRKIYS